MHALMWLGIVVILLGVLVWVVFKLTVGFAILLFVIGIALIVWGAVKLKQVV